MSSMVEVSANRANRAETATVRRWFDVNTAADYCSVPVKTIRKAISDGKVPRGKVGHKFIMDRRDLDNWLLGELIREQ